MSPTVVGPVTFTRRKLRKGEGGVGTSQQRCQVPGCTRSASWETVMAGWPTDAVCGPHATEWQLTLHSILDPADPVTRAA